MAENSLIYVNDDQTEIYIPTIIPFNMARKMAAQHAQDTGDNWSRTRYTGARLLFLHDHDDWDAYDCGVCKEQPAWCFEVYEGTYRD